MFNSKIMRHPVFVLVATACIIFAAFGIRQSMGLFMRPISDGLGWGREILSLALATQNLLIGFAAPFFGAIADRWGPPKTLAVGGLLFSVGLLIMSLASTPFVMFMSAGVMMGIGLGACGMPLVLATVSKVAPEQKRSLWIGIITTCGTGGQLLLVPVSRIAIGELGWPASLLVLSIIAMLIVPIALATSSAITKDTGKDNNISIREALREAFYHRGYRLLTSGFFVCGFHVSFVAIHLPAFVHDRCAEPGLGATALMLIAFCNMIGAATSGWLGGRFSKKYLLSAIYSGRALVMCCFLLLPITPSTVIIFSCFIGLLWLSTVPPTSGLVSQIFGLQYMGMLYGIVFLSHQLGAFVGVWLGGYIFDSTGSYAIAWWTAVALAVASAVIHLPIDERPLARLNKT